MPLGRRGRKWVCFRLFAVCPVIGKGFACCLAQVAPVAGEVLQSCGFGCDSGNACAKLASVAFVLSIAFFLLARNARLRSAPVWALCPFDGGLPRPRRRGGGIDAAGIVLLVECMPPGIAALIVGTLSCRAPLVDGTPSGISSARGRIGLVRLLVGALAAAGMPSTSSSLIRVRRLVLSALRHGRPAFAAANVCLPTRIRSRPRILRRGAARPRSPYLRLRRTSLRFVFVVHFSTNVSLVSRPMGISSHFCSRHSNQ